VRGARQRRRRRRFGAVGLVAAPAARRCRRLPGSLADVRDAAVPAHPFTSIGRRTMISPKFCRQFPRPPQVRRSKPPVRRVAPWLTPHHGAGWSHGALRCQAATSARCFVSQATSAARETEFAAGGGELAEVGGLRARRLVPGGPSSHRTHSCAAGRLAVPRLSPRRAAPCRAAAAGALPSRRSVSVALEVAANSRTLSWGMFAALYRSHDHPRVSRCTRCAPICHALTRKSVRM